MNRLLGMGAMLCLASLTGCGAGVRAELPEDAVLPSCAELDGVSTLFVESRVAISGVTAGVRSGRPEISWYSTAPRFLVLLPEDLLPADGASINVGGLPALTSIDPDLPDDYGPTFARLQTSGGEATVWARIDLRELCGPEPPEAPLTVWISTAVEQQNWRLIPAAL